MAEGKITIEGDATGAIDAAEDASVAVEGLTSEVVKLGEESEKAGKVGGNLSGSLTRVSSTAKTSRATIGGLSSSMGSLGQAISLVNPKLGSLTSAIGSSAGGLDSLTKSTGGASMATRAMTLALNPYVLAAAAAAGAGYLLYRQHQKTAQAAAEAATAHRNYGVELSKVAGIASRAASGGMEQFSDMLQDFSRYVPNADALLEAFDLEGAPERAVAALDELETQTISWGNTLHDTRQEIGRMRGALAAQSQKMDRLWRLSQKGGPLGREAAKRLEEEKEKRVEMVQALNDEMEARRELQARHKEGVALYARGIKLLDASKENQPEMKDPVDWAARADAILKAAAATSDYGAAIALVLEDSGSLGSEMTSALAGLSDDYLIQVGLTQAQVDLLRERNELEMSGAELAALRAREIDAEVEAKRRGAEEYDAQMAREQEARDQAAADLAEARANKAADYEETLKRQQGLLGFYRMSFEEQKAHEEELLRLALERAETGQLLSSQQMSLVRAHYEEEGELEKQKALDQEANVEAMKNSIKDMGTQMLAQGIGDMASAFGEMAVSSGEAGDAMGKSAKDSVAAIAKQFGSLFLTTGLGMVFMPGMQAQGAGLIAGGIALLAIGGAVGAAGKKGAAEGKSGDKGGGAGDAGTQTVVVDSWETTSSRDPGRRARDSGDAVDNADRYGINRSREWA